MKPASIQIMLGTIVFQLIVLSQPSPESHTKELPPQEYVKEARAKVNQGEFTSALDLLDQTLKAGFGNPMQLVLEQEIQPLIDHPTYRERFRK